MDATRANDEFSLLDGPLHRLGRRIGLVRGRTNTLAVGIALGFVTWAVGVLLAAGEGRLAQLFTVDVIGAHVRLLVAIPLFFACESILDPQLARFARYCARSGLLTGPALDRFEAQLARTMRLNAHWLPETVFLAAAVLIAVAAPEPPWGGVTSALDAGRAPSLVGWWYWIVGLTLFRFLLFRWLWRLALWCLLLWRLSRLDLRLMPAHADGNGGLAVLGDVQAHLLPLVAGLSAVLSASYAEDVATGHASLESLYLAIPALLLGAALLVLGPLTVFAGRLWECRQRGMADYMELAARYAAAFDRKWIGRDAGRDAGPESPLLGSPDIQTLADFSTAVAIVRNLRVIPVGRRMLFGIAAATLVPALPLLTFKYPLATMVDQVLNRLVGL